MTVCQIVSEWLKANRFDGLCNHDCGCGLNNLMPCEDGGNISSCVPAYKDVCRGTVAECEDCGMEACDGLTPGTERFSQHRPMPVEQLSAGGGGEQ